MASRSVHFSGTGKIRLRSTDFQFKSYLSAMFFASRHCAAACWTCVQHGCHIAAMLDACLLNRDHGKIIFFPPSAPLLLSFLSLFSPPLLSLPVFLFFQSLQPPSLSLLTYCKCHLSFSSFFCVRCFLCVNAGE